MPELKRYYELQKNSNAEYKRFLKQLSNKTTSKEFFSTNDGVLEPERQKLHKSIVSTKYLSLYQTQSTPRIHFILGSIGSGKTSLKDQVIKDEELKSFLYINFDDLKLRLPEYKILKELNPKKAAHFVQSESSRLAGMLYKKSLQKKVNIIYEKNLRTKDNKLHIVEEIKKAFKKNYSVTLHVVFLDSYKEAWRRVQKRYEKIKRYVPGKEVKDTFQNLFPNLNKLLSTDFKQEYSVQFWYNGLWDRDMPEKAHAIGVVVCRNKPDYKIQIKTSDTDLVVVAKGTYKFHGFFFKKMKFLPERVKTHLARVDCLKPALLKL